MPKSGRSPLRFDGVFARYLETDCLVGSQPFFIMIASSDARWRIEWTAMNSTRWTGTGTHAPPKQCIGASSGMLLHALEVARPAG